MVWLGSGCRVFRSSEGLEQVNHVVCSRDLGFWGFGWIEGLGFRV